MPARNAEDSVERAVRSIVEGTLTDIELVVVDDASEDSTGEILDRIAATDDRVRVFHLDEHDFIGAINHGVAQCRAPYIARMDADDVASATRLECQLAYLKEHAEDVDGVGGRVRVVDASGRAVESWRRYESWVNDHLDVESILAYRFVESPIANPTAMVRREVFELGYRDGDFPEDYELWLRAMHAGFRFAKLEDEVLDWIDRPTRATRTHPRYSRDAFDRCRREYLRLGPLADAAEVILWGAGDTGKPWLRWLLAEGISVRRILELSPRKIGKTIGGVPMVSPRELGQPDGTPLVIAVGAEGARGVILEQLRARGYVPGRDAWFVA